MVSAQLRLSKEYSFKNGLSRYIEQNSSLIKENLINMKDTKSGKHIIMIGTRKMHLL